MSQHCINLDQDNNDTAVKHVSKPTLIDFWAPWCGPCKTIGPVIEELAEEYQDSAIIGKCTIDRSPELAQQSGVRSVPTLLFIQRGEVIQRIAGAVDKGSIEKILNKTLRGEKIVRPFTRH